MLPCLSCPCDCAWSVRMPFTSWRHKLACPVLPCSGHVQQYVCSLRLQSLSLPCLTFVRAIPVSTSLALPFERQTWCLVMPFPPHSHVIVLSLPALDCPGHGPVLSCPRHFLTFAVPVLPFAPLSLSGLALAFVRPHACSCLCPIHICTCICPGLSLRVLCLAFCLCPFSWPCLANHCSSCALTCSFPWPCLSCAWR